MKVSQLQTPQKDQMSANRRTKSTPDPKRNLRKVVKKSLNPEFTSVLEEDGADIASSEEFSLISGESPCSALTESIFSLTCPTGTPASQIVTVSDIASPSPTVSLEEDVGFGALSKKYEVSGLDSFKMLDSVKADMVVDSLREARIQVLKSKELGHSRNFLDAVLNVVIEELCDCKYGDKGWLDKLLASNVSLAILGFMMLSFAFVVWFLSVGSNGPPSVLPPT